MPRPALRLLRRLVLVCLGLAAMAGLLAWLMGAFQHRLPPGPPAPSTAPAAQGTRHTVAAVPTVRTETAVGTIRAIRETVVASRLLGRVVKLHIERAGQAVQKDDLLVEIEATDLQAMVAQSKAMLAAATTRRDQAKADFERSSSLAQQGIASTQKLDADRSALAAAEAEVDRANQAIAGAESAVAFATVKAPITGIVVDKQINQGDVVQPGQPICTLYDPTRLQLVAVVREELAGRLQVGQQVDVTLDALGKQCRGTVAEIVPQAQAQSRAFEVKITGPCQPGIVTGMFGRLHVPLDPTTELRVPRGAVQTVGQLDFVQVAGADGKAVRRFVRLGRERGEDVEVLSGLAAGEVVLVAAGR